MIKILIVMFKNIIVVGSTGLVGIEFVKLLTDSITLYKSTFNIILISNNYVNHQCPDTRIIYQPMSSIDYSVPSIFINCANAEQAVEIANKIQTHSVLIDNSSEYRMNTKVPLIVPEINFIDYDHFKSNIIANPNCSTIILAMLLNPFISNNFTIKRIVISTYQAASGAGKIGLQELKVQANDYVNDNPITSKYWEQQYIFNTFIHNSPIDTNKYCQEENKLINETNKIFKTKMGISPTCVRVPVLRSHCSSVNIEFDKPISYDQLINLLNSVPDTLEIINNADTHKFPTSISSNNSHLVQVGHIRPDYSLGTNKGWNFWISGDQLLRGAAYNAFMIMKGILKKV